MATSGKPNIFSAAVLKDFIKKLPAEVILVILSKLGPKMLGRLKTYSPRLQNMISAQFFVDMSNHSTSLQLEIYDGGQRLSICNVDEHGSAVTKRVIRFPCKLVDLHHSNGLIGFYNETTLERKLNLCNLATLERVELKSVHERTEEQHFYVGYDPLTKHHKVIVWLEKSALGSYPSEGRVLTVEEGTSWRPVSNLPRVKLLSQRSHAAVSGTICWLVGAERCLRTFNLNNETSGIIELPEYSFFYLSEKIFKISLTEFEGSLSCVVQAHRSMAKSNPVGILDMWLLQDLQSSHWIEMTPQLNTEVPMEDTNLNAYYEGKLGPIVLLSIAAHNGAIVIAAADDQSRYLFWYSPLNGRYKKMLLRGVDIPICLKKNVDSKLNFSKLLSNTLLYKVVNSLDCFDCSSAQVE